MTRGTGLTAADDSLNGYHGTLTGGSAWAPGVVGTSGVEFDGATGFVDMPAPVVDTSQSFSVAAWVRINAPAGFRTAVSVDGESVGGFFLQRRNDGRFAFTIVGSDAPGPGTVASATFTARLAEWYHLTGVYDRAAGTVIGDTATTWGARRAADGHPAPFPLSYVEVGNEDWFDTSGSYAWRFSRMYDAIKARYPHLKVIATTGGLQGGAASSTPTGRVPDVSDDHYYFPPSFFAGSAGRYDRADRAGRQYLIGEYGAQEGSPTPTLRAAIGEAAFLTGLERNSDMVIGSMYAPILVNESQPNWPANMVGFDAGRSYGSPSYWVVQMFGNNLGRQVVGSRLTGARAVEQVVTATTQGGVTTFYVKIVNSTGRLQSARLHFAGVTSVDGTGTRTVLTGDPDTRNTLATPGAVAPVTEQVTGLGQAARLSLPAYSVTVLRVTGRP